jgi:S-adenosylmethionine:tRNA-ribosyltransferase-isomerase (queuine synthetase)
MMGRIADSILKVDSEWLNITFKTVLRLTNIDKSGQSVYVIGKTATHRNSEIYFHNKSTRGNYSRVVTSFLEIMISNDPKLYWTRIIALLIKNGNADEVKELLVELEI